MLQWIRNKLPREVVINNSGEITEIRLFILHAVTVFESTVNYLNVLYYLRDRSSDGRTTHHDKRSSERVGSPLHNGSGL